MLYDLVLGIMFFTLSFIKLMLFIQTFYNEAVSTTLANSAVERSFPTDHSYTDQVVSDDLMIAQSTDVIETSTVDYVSTVENTRKV